jgi:phospholipid/cholesterol/gamma-HCH transport system substrate-binding protein
MTRELKVGLTVIAGLICAGLLVVFLGRIHFTSPGYPVLVDFRYVDSLKVGAPVLYGGGVKIGEVDGLSISKGLVRVSLHVDKGVQIPLDSVVTIHTSGILGEKYVQVAAGDATLGSLQPKAELIGVDPGSLDRTLQRVEALTDFLEPLLKDPKFKGSIELLLGTLNKTVDQLSHLVSDNSADLRSGVQNLKELSASLRARSEELKPILASASGMMNEKNKKAVEQSLESLQAFSLKLDKVLAQIDEKKGTVGMLLYDDETAENLRELLRDLKRHPWKLLWKK